MNPIHHNNGTRSYSPNWQVQCNIASQDPKRDNSVSNAKIKDRRDSYGSDNNWHYSKGCFHLIHSSRKRLHSQYHNICQPDDMDEEATFEASWIIGKSKNTPSSPGDWQMMKQWICYPLSVFVTLCWYSLRGSQGLNDKKKLQPGLALANMIYSCIEGTPLYKGKRRRGNNNWRDDVLCHLRHQSQVKHEACGKSLRGI